MPLQVVQANATMPKPSCSSSGSSFASSRYSCTVFEPGASEDFTQGLRVRPRALALRASKPAAITLRGLLVFVQEVIAAMITAPSGIWPGIFFPFARDAALGERRGRQALVRIGRAGHVAHDGRQIELQHALVLRGLSSESAHKPVCLA